MTKLKRSKVGFLVIFASLLFVIALIILPIYSLFSQNSGDGKVEFINEVYSPNKAFKAVEYLYMGGGAVGFCDRNITIQKQDAEKPSPNNLPKNIFSAKCGSEVSVTWVNDQEISLIYSTKNLQAPKV